MNKFSAVFPAVLICAGFAGMLWYTRSPVSSSAADVSPRYTVTIPESVSLGGTAEISMTDLGLSQGDYISVRLSGTGETDNAFRLHNGSHELTYAVTLDGDPVTVGGQILTAYAGDSVRTAELAFSLPEKRAYPGTYTGTVQFTVKTVHTESRQVMIPGIGYINAKNGESSVSVHLYNPEENACLFRYEIVLADTGETLWTSEELLAPGESISSIELAHPLETGTYAAKLIVDALTMDGQNKLNGSEMDFEFRVKEGGK